MMEGQLTFFKLGRNDSNWDYLMGIINIAINKGYPKLAYCGQYKMKVTAKEVKLYERNKLIKVYQRT